MKNIITTNIDVVVFPNWLYGQTHRYNKKQALLDIIRDVENDRIVGANFLVDPDYQELRETDFKHAGSTRPLTEWVTSKKFKYEDAEVVI